MFSASFSKPVSCNERPSFLPAASTFLPAWVKASSRRVLRSSGCTRLVANFHRLRDLDHDYGTAERPGQLHHGALYLERDGDRDGKPFGAQVTSELGEFGT